MSNSIITTELLTRLGTDRPSLWAPVIDEAVQRRGVNSVTNMLQFIPNVCTETGGMKVILENMVYTDALRIQKVWPKYFPTLASAAPYINQPEKLAAKVYGRLGGYDVRGRGLSQLTGDANYEPYAVDRNMTLAQVTAYLTTPAGAADSAVWFFIKSGCVTFAGRGDTLGCRVRWAGSQLGLTTVESWQTKMRWALGALAGGGGSSVQAGAGVAHSKSVASVPGPSGTPLSPADSLMQTELDLNGGTDNGTA